MKATNSIRPERPSDDDAIEALQAAAFGPGAYTRAAYRVREQAPHDPRFSFVTENGGGELIGSVRLTAVRIGDDAGYLLGPLVVDPGYKNMGYGRALVRHALQEVQAAGHPMVLLVGDAPYYQPLGFTPVPRGKVRMPGPVDLSRILVAELVPGAAAGLEGTVRGVPSGKEP